MFKCCRKNEKILKKGSLAVIYLDYIGGEEYVIKKYAEVNNRSSSSKYISSYTKEIIDQGVENHKLLIHPNIINLYNISTKNNHLCLQLEYAEQGDLYKYSSEYNIIGRSAKIIPIISQIVNGLKYMHSLGIIHLDLKLENIFMSRDIPKIGDFDYSYNKNSNQRLLYRGSPHSCSPEMWELKYTEVDTWSDVWSLGVMIYELYTNISPFINSQLEILKYNIINCRYNINNINTEDIANIIKNIFIRDCTARYDLKTISEILCHIVY